MSGLVSATTTLINVNSGKFRTGAALVDDTRSYTFKGGIPFSASRGAQPKTDFGFSRKS